MVSELASTTIILAAAVAMAVALAAYMAGLLPAIQTTPQVMVYPDSFIDPDTGAACIHLANRGTTYVQIYRVEVAGAGAATATILLPPGSEQTVCLPLPAAAHIPPGSQRTLRLYTVDGYVITETVYAMPGTTPAIATGNATGLLSLQVTAADEIEVTITGTIAFRTTGHVTLVYTDGGSTSFGPDDTIQIDNPSSQPLGPNNQQTSITINSAGTQQALSIQYLPATRVIRAGNAVVASNKIIECTSAGSTAACSPIQVTATQLTITITISLRNAAVTATIDGKPVIDSTSYTGTITVTITRPIPPTIINYDPATKTLTIQGVQATITTT